MYMLDTDICIYIIKRKPPEALSRLEQAKPGGVCMSAVTFAELMAGALRSRQVEANVSTLKAIAELIPVVPFDREAAAAYGHVRSDLARRGERIGGYDMLIAAHAVSRSDTLVTNNEREFGRVKDLVLENWAKESRRTSPQ
jgi:tRNA(fMet)-specific endonuclease VapC